MEVYPEARPLIDNGASADHRADHRTDLRGESGDGEFEACLLYTSPSPRDRQKSRMPSSA